MPDESEAPERRYPARTPWRRFHNRRVIVFLTVCTRARAPILAGEEIHHLLVSQWRSADSWTVGRYVILPDHVHLFASPSDLDAPDVRAWVRYWKSLATRNWPVGRDGPIWQRDVWDRQLRTGDSYARKWEYVRDNPVRHGLVACAQEWPYQGELNVLAWRD